MSDTPGLLLERSVMDRLPVGFYTRAEELGLQRMWQFQAEICLSFNSSFQRLIRFVSKQHQLSQRSSSSALPSNQFHKYGGSCSYVWCGLETRAAQLDLKLSSLKHESER